MLSMHMTQLHSFAVAISCLMCSLHSTQELVGAVLSVYERALGSDNAEESPELRAAILRQLDAIAEEEHSDHFQESPGASDALVADGARIVRSLLMPNMRWKVGKASAHVRFQACVALSTLLRRGSQSAASAVREEEGGLSTLVSCMEEEHAADTRKAACHLMERIMLLIASTLSDEDRRLIYPALLRRMDDARLEIRTYAAAAVGSFFATMGSEYCETNTRYLLEGFVVHMDDADEHLRYEVQAALEKAVTQKPSLVKAVLTSARAKHRTPELCDELISKCDETIAS